MTELIAPPMLDTSPLHVMLVDDEDDYHLITRMMLRKAGFLGRLTVFMDPNEAMDHLKNGQDRPDVLLVDINMPATNGFEFLTECQQQDLITCGSTTVVMCSSSNRPVDMEQASRTGCVQEYIEKPLTAEQFNRIAAGHFQRLHHRVNA
ncbi:MAG: response regulator [Flavobacteriales bacterium]|nr:response regulator [Flavobacteriales bacterium]MBP9080124.1 response regulator [Flavobacteriales bacterium]